MLTRKFDINRYDTYAVKEVIKKILMDEYIKYTLSYRGNFLYEGQVNELNITPSVSFSFPSDTKIPIEDRIKTLGGRLATDVFCELHNRYDKQVEKTTGNFVDIKEKCDYVFEGNKDYLALCKQLDNLYICEAVTALRSFYNKIMSSQSTRNIAYQTRNIAYKNLKSPTDIGCV